MFTTEQIQYIDDVLGTSSQAYLQSRPMVQPAEVACGSAAAAVGGRIVIVTPELSAGEQALLQKILASIQLVDFLQVKQLEPSLNPKHILSFQGATPGRNGKVWDFPALASMLGEGPDVAAQKKTTWTLLKQLAQEL